MAVNASVIWTGDTTFDLNFDGESTTQACFITTLYNTTWYGYNGPITASGSLNNAATSYVCGVRVLQKTSGAWGGVLNCAWRDVTPPARIEEVYILFGDEQRTRERALYINSLYTVNRTISSVNNYIQSQSWSYILRRQRPLSTPTGLYADNITSDSARVSWTAVENASVYKVEYRQAAGGGQTYPWIEAQD